MSGLASMTTRSDLDQFWRDNDIAMGDSFGPHIPQAAMGITMDRDCIFAELGMESDMKRLEEDGFFAQQCIKAYNDKAQQMVGRRLLDESACDPTRRFPRVKEVGELFECSRIWQSESWWLLEAADSPKKLEARSEEHTSELQSH